MENEKTKTDNYPEYVHLFPEEFADIGKILKVYPLLDVVFVWTEGMLLHYRGVMCGWQLFETRPMGEEQAQEYADNWLKNLKIECDHD